MLESTVANSRSQPRGYTSQQQWEARRSEITRLYADQNVTLKEVIEIMKTSYSFFATYVWSLVIESLCLIEPLPEKGNTRGGYNNGD
jgi:hypothetical protein